MQRLVPRVALITAALGLSIACDLVPRQVSRDDPRLTPMWEAIDRVDRESLGFTPISPTAEIFLSRLGGDYDATLDFVEGEVVSRSIAFRKTGDGYLWIYEHETFDGPHQYDTPDGRVSESISLTYETSQVSGVPLDSLYISYFGDDPRLAGRLGLTHVSGLTLSDVKPIAQEWTASARLHPRKQSLFEKVLRLTPWW